MKRKEQIRNKARELGKTYFPDSANIWARSNVEAAYVENACVEMAEWADTHPNLRCANEFPETDEQTYLSCDCVVWDSSGARYFGFYNSWDECWYTDSYDMILFVTYWYPLPPIPKKVSDK